VTTLTSRPPRSWNGKGEALGVVVLLRAEGGDQESQFGLVAPVDVRQITFSERFFLIVGGLYSVTALRKITMRVTVYTKHRLTLQKP